MENDQAVLDEAETTRPLTPETIRAVREALAGRDWERVRSLCEPLHSADLADLVHQLSSSEREAFVEAFGGQLDPEMLIDLDETVRDEIISLMEPDEVAAAVSELDTDDAVYLLEDLEPEQREAVLESVPTEERVAVEKSLNYAEDTAGRLMQRDLIAVPSFWTIGHTIDYLRETEDLPDDFYEIYVVDPAHHPIGAVPLNRAMRTKRDVPISDIMERDLHVIPADMEQEEVAYLFQQYNLSSAPVVDKSGRLIGVIMVDDILDVIEEEAEEDLLALGGVQDDNFYDSVWKTTMSRAPWLAVNLGTALLASAVISLFDATIEKAVALAVLMPIVASMGGNAGTQTLTIAVRALATRELTPHNAWRLVNKEMLVGFGNGVLMALLVGVVTYAWFTDARLALVIVLAMIVNMISAGLAGILVPLALDRMKIDPALASSVFVTTITDVLGFFSFLGLASLLLF